MFLVGGPAYAGTTLLAHLMNQGRLVCLDEPGFEEAARSKRGLAQLRLLLPAARFPPRPPGEPSYPDVYRWTQALERCIRPLNLGVKTCNWTFIKFAVVYRARRAPVIAIVRDIRDALVRPLPPWLDEAGLNARYRAVWQHRHLYHLCLRYEDLVRAPEREFLKIAWMMRRPLAARRMWDPASVHPNMVKQERHALLTGGALSTERVGIWKRAEVQFSPETFETAALMGYSDSR